MPEPLTLQLNVTEDPAALSAAFVYSHLVDSSDLYHMLRRERQNPNHPFATLSWGDTEVPFDTLSRPDGTTARMREVIDYMGYEPVALVLRKKGIRGGVRVAETAATR